MAKKVSEANTLTKHCLKALSLKGFNVWRQNNGGVYDAKIKAYRANSSTPGVPDIIGYRKSDGVFIGVEIKVGKDKLSMAQDAFLKGIIKAGGIAFTISSIEEIENKIYNMDQDGYNYPDF